MINFIEYALKRFRHIVLATSVKNLFLIDGVDIENLVNLFTFQK